MWDLFTQGHDSWVGNLSWSQSPFKHTLLAILIVRIDLIIVTFASTMMRIWILILT
jgi:hypothetical protein